MSETAWSVVGVSALTGSVAAFLLQQVKSWWDRPKLKIHYETGHGYFTETKNANNADVTYIRARVSNQKREIAEECSVYVSNVRAFKKDGSQSELPHQDSYRLPWSSRSENGKDVLEISLPTGINQFVDIGSIVHGTDQIQFVGHSIPLRFKSMLVGAKRYEFTLVAVANGAKAARYVVRFEWEGTAATLRRVRPTIRQWLTDRC